MAVVSGEFVLTQRCFSMVAEQLQLTLPASVATEPVYYEEGEWEREHAVAYDELAQIGLLEAGEPSPMLVESLRVLCRGSVEFFGYVAAGQRRYSLHVSARGHDAVFTALTHNQITLRPAHPQSLVSTMLAELPGTQPAGARSLSAAETELNAPAGPVAMPAEYTNCSTNPVMLVGGSRPPHAAASTTAAASGRARSTSSTSTKAAG